MQNSVRSIHIHYNAPSYYSGTMCGGTASDKSLSETWPAPMGEMALSSSHKQLYYWLNLCPSLCSQKAVLGVQQYDRKRRPSQLPLQSITPERGDFPSEWPAAGRSDSPRRPATIEPFVGGWWRRPAESSTITGRQPPARRLTHWRVNRSAPDLPTYRRRTLRAGPAALTARPRAADKNSAVTGRGGRQTHRAGDRRRHGHRSSSARRRPTDDAAACDRSAPSVTAGGTTVRRPAVTGASGT